MDNSEGTVTEKLQRAAALIKSGDKQGGQKLLVEVLAIDPRNVQAWLWMATVTTGDKRQYCLEKAVSIDPNNAHARQALAQIGPAKASPPASSPPVYTPPPQPASTEPAAIPSTAERVPDAKPIARPADLEIVSPDVWIRQRKYHIDVSVLTKDDLTVGRVGLNRKREFQTRLEQNLPISDLFIAKETVPLSNISKVVNTLATITVYYLKQNGSTGTVYVACPPDDDTIKAAIDAFERRLGRDYERTQAPMRTCMALGIPTAAMVIVVAATAFCTLSAQEAMTRGIGGSARTRAMWAILALLGPNGVLCIGGVLLLLCIILLVNWGLKPPLETTIARKITD